MHHLFTRVLFTRVLAVASFLLLLPGCTSLLAPKSDPARYYVLTATEPAGNAAASAGSPVAAHLNIASFRIPAYLDRSEIVWHTAGNRVAISDTDLWLEPLSKGSARVFSQYLARHLGSQSVTYPPATATAQDVRVSVDVLQFQIHPNADILLQANWQFSGPDLDKQSSTFTLRVPLPANSSLDTSVSAMSAALDKFASEIARHIQQSAAKK